MLSDSDNPVADDCFTLTQSVYTDMKLNPLKEAPTCIRDNITIAQEKLILT
jgi:hypothetical protein